jgi:hypothetical protein
MTSVVLIWGAVAVMLGVFLLCLDLGSFTYGWIRAKAAVDAYADAQADGLESEQAEEAAFASLSPRLRAEARIEEREGRIELSVRPRSVAGFRMPRVTATLGADASDRSGAQGGTR